MMLKTVIVVTANFIFISTLMVYFRESVSNARLNTAFLKRLTKSNARVKSIVLAVSPVLTVY